MNDSGTVHGARNRPSASRPTAADLEAARRRVLRDVTAPGLDVLFCGINPGLYSGATGHHFARPGNRFGPALFLSGFTPTQLTAGEDRRLPEFGCGVTNLVARTTATADELTPEELVDGGRRLVRKVGRFQPRWVAILGVGAYRRAFGRPTATTGPQAESLGSARLWILPNPSGLNAHYQLPALAEAFRALREAAGLPDRRTAAHEKHGGGPQARGETRTCGEPPPRTRDRVRGGRGRGARGAADEGQNGSDR